MSAGFTGSPRVSHVLKKPQIRLEKFRHLAGSFYTNYQAFERYPFRGLFHLHTFYVCFATTLYLVPQDVGAKPFKRNLGF